MLSIFNDLDNWVSLNRLVEISYKISFHYIRQNYHRTKYILEYEGITIKEFAFDSIAYLFTRNKKNNLLEIHNAFINWEPPIRNDDDALEFLIKIVHSKVEQSITRFLRDNDPIFSKILNWTNYLIRKFGYKKISYFGTIYIVENYNNSIKIIFIKNDEFNQIPSSLFSSPKSALKSIFDYLRNKYCNN